jgi:BirA family biotin operon repressor/biotin-[acetyl-CoA-carboxylase] ligase
MDRKQEVLRQLRETGSYVSGQQLCETLGVSRTAVWKIIKKLKEEGYPIEAVTNKGYRLLSVEGKDLFNKEELERRLQTRWAGRPLIFSEETGSTNADIFRLSEQDYRQGTLAVTSKQTAGKGRRGRTWISPPDVNVYMSILLRPDFKPETAPMLTLVMALAVHRACEELYGKGAGAVELSADGAEACRFGIKWPNDIVVSARDGSWRKICGILTEMRMEEKEIRDIVIGIGINVNQAEFPEEIRETAGSLALALGHPVSRADLTAEVWKYFEEYYEVFEQARSLSPLREVYERALVNRGKKVRVLDPESPYEGVALGINEEGELLVKPDDGSEVRQVGTGEVSVRGVMGYV